MPPLPQPREGKRLRIKDRPLEFSFWPVERTTRRYGLGVRVFATDPWTVIRRSLERRCPAGSRRKAGLALIEQAEDFYRAAESGVKAAKPLLLYYCFMNLAKAYVLAQGTRSSVDNAKHGLSEKLDMEAGGAELINAYLDVFPSSDTTVNIFDELLSSIRGHGIEKQMRLDLPILLPQVVPGHRLWVEGVDGKQKERFVSLEQVEIVKAIRPKEIWIRMYMCADDLRRIGIGHQDALHQAQLAASFREVACHRSVDERHLVCFEQTSPTSYGHRPSDRIQELVSTVRHQLWRTVLTAPPYRKYYIYPAPSSEHNQVLPQILSIYAITFYLGSIVRYRPHHFDKILGGPFGPLIEAFLNDQPTQFIYLMASEFAEKEVTKAAIV